MTTSFLWVLAFLLLLQGSWEQSQQAGSAIIYHMTLSRSTRRHVHAWERIFGNSEIFTRWTYLNPWVLLGQSSQWGHSNPSNLDLVAFEAFPFCSGFSQGVFHLRPQSPVASIGIFLSCSLPVGDVTEEATGCTSPRWVSRFSTLWHLLLCPDPVPAGSPRGREESSVWLFISCLNHWGCYYKIEQTGELTNNRN